MEYITKQFVTKKKNQRVSNCFLIKSIYYRMVNHILIFSFQSRMLSKHFPYLVHSVHVCMFNIDYASVVAVFCEI